MVICDNFPIFLILQFANVASIFGSWSLFPRDFFDLVEFQWWGSGINWKNK